MIDWTVWMGDLLTVMGVEGFEEAEVRGGVVGLMGEREAEPVLRRGRRRVHVGKDGVQFGKDSRDEERRKRTSEEEIIKKRTSEEEIIKRECTRIEREERRNF